MKHISWQRRATASLFLAFMFMAAVIMVIPPAIAQDEAAAPPAEGAEAAPAEGTEAAPAEAAPAEAAPAAEEAAAPAEEDEPGLFGKLWEMYWIGGSTMHPMLLCSIAALTVIMERTMAYRKAKLDPIEFITRVRDAVLSGGAKTAIAVCDEAAYARRPVSNVTKSALLKFDEPADELAKAIENSAVIEVARLEKFLPVLASVANIGPLFGFLGTVTGMINSFDAIAKYGMTNPSLVAKGISEALITTAFGLFIALGAQPFYNYYTSIVTKYIRQMEAASQVLLETHGEVHRKGR